MGCKNTFTYSPISLDRMFTVLYIISMKQIMVRDVPDDLHIEFKLLCVKREISMNRRIIELMREDLKKTKEKQ